MNKKSYGGFSLIEVMIALVILAVGVLGISKLQSTLIKNSANANQRSVAVSIAQKKIDDLKSYAQLTSSTSWSAGMAASEVAYNHIQNNQGGAALGTTNLQASTAIPSGNTSYYLEWEVEDYDQPGGFAIPTAVSTPSSDMKLVTVTVSWDDESGTGQEVSLKTVIDSYPPSASALNDTGSTGGEGPKSNYTPELAPDVIDVDVNLNDDQNRQTSKPLPDAVKTGADSNTLVTFEVVTYQTAASEIVQTRREEYQTVDCECQFTADGAAFPPAHVVWDEENNDRYDYIELGANGLAQTITKPTATQTGNANAVDELCTICCRDHHDIDSYAIKYSPGASTVTGGDHVHYQADGTTVANQATNDVYVESCRFKRVDGILRIFQDWKLYDLTTMDRTALASLAADGGIQDTYSNYVQDYVLNTVGVSTITPTKPDAVTDISTTVGGAQQLEARGIYIDKVYDLDKNETPSAYTDYITADPVNDDRLEKIPFSEVNLSLLAHWASDDDSQVSVTDEAVATVADPTNDYYGTYSRGYIYALAETGASGIPVTATIDSSNNGITQITNASNTIAKSDPITVVVGAAAGNFDITGSYSFTFPQGDNSVDNTSYVTTGDAANCTLTGSPGNTITCNVASPWTGTISVIVKVNGSQKCDGTATYSGSNITSDPTFILSGTCN